METSCGVVLVNYGTVLLLQYPQGHWDLPKGHVEEDDENYQITAARELGEETGITEIEFMHGFEEKTSYSFKHKGRKTSSRWYPKTLRIPIHGMHSLPISLQSGFLEGRRLVRKSRSQIF